MRQHSCNSSRIPRRSTVTIAVQPELGDVIHFFCLTTQQPKAKFGVVVCQASLLGVFLINTEPAAFIQARPELMSLQLVVEAATHSFLAYDSYLDCSIFHGLPEECHASVTVVGKLDGQKLAQLPALVGGARTLSGRQKQAILAALQGDTKTNDSA